MLHHIDHNEVWPHMSKQSRQRVKSLIKNWGNSTDVQTESQERRKRETAITAVIGKQ